MRHDHRAAGQLVVQEPLEALEAGEVEVVRRLVEQEHVEAGEHDRGQARPRRLPARERGHLEVEDAGREPEVGAHRADAGVEVGRAEREVALERVGVRVVGARAPGRPSARRRGVERVLGVGRDPGAPGEVRAHGLARRAARAPAGR